MYFKALVITNFSKKKREKESFGFGLMTYANSLDFF